MEECRAGRERCREEALSMAEYKTNNRVRLGLAPSPLQQIALRGLKRGRQFFQAEIDRMIVLGIKPVNLCNGPWMTQVDRVLFDGEFFDFADADDDRGEKVFTMGVRSDTGLVDVAAWNPASGRLATWLEQGYALGEYLIKDHVDEDSPGLAVFRSPLDWLRADCCGIVILRKSFTREVLAFVKVLLAENEYHRVELRKLFLAGDLQPRILLRTPVNEPKAVA